MSTPTIDEVNAAMLQSLATYLPPARGAPLPAPSVSLDRLEVRSAGLGRHRGSEIRGPLGLVELRGIRLDAVARFQVWGADPTQADVDAASIKQKLLADVDNLRPKGFLQISLGAAPPAVAVALPGAAWQKVVDARVLYEFPYEDTDGAQSLIAQIPISIDSVFGDLTRVRDQMTRWDNTKLRPPLPPLPGAAPLLVVRGPSSVGVLGAVAFIPGATPTGKVTLARTFDGATGIPVAHANLAGFLQAVAGTNPAERNATVTFPSVVGFLSVLSNLGTTIAMGDWDGNGVTDEYKIFGLPFSPAIALPERIDRFEIAFEKPQFDKTAVVYLRAASG